MIHEELSALRRLLADFSAETGEEVSVTSYGGDETPFSFEYGGRTVTLYLKGTGEKAKSNSRILGYFLRNADYAQPVSTMGEYLRRILQGRGDRLYAVRFLEKYALTDGECYVCLVVTKQHQEEALAHLEDCVADTAALCTRMDEDKIAVVSFGGAAQSSSEFGEFLAHSLYEELGLKAEIGIGCEVPSFVEIASSCGQAATAVRMSELFRSRGLVHTYREYLLVKLLEDIPTEKVREYIRQFGIGRVKEIFNDEEMMHTAGEFLDNSLNISETSRNLYMHRNTLMYRLDKIERITGLNIRNFPDAVTFRVISILHRLSKE